MRLLRLIPLLLAACSTAAPHSDPPTILPPPPGAVAGASPRVAAKAQAEPSGTGVAPSKTAPLPPPPPARALTPVAPVTTGVSVYFLAEVFEEPRMGSRVVGWIQTGRSVALGPKAPVDGGRCWQGWYPLADGRGFVCGGRGVRVGSTRAPARRGTSIAKLDQIVPYHYAYVHAEGGTPRYRRRPTPEERDAREALGPASIDGDLVGSYMQRGFMVSVRGLAGHVPNAFWSCVRGGYVRTDHAYTLRPRPFAGVDLGATAEQLPIAFVTGYGPPRFSVVNERLREDGDAQRLSHFGASHPIDVGGVRVLAMPDGAFVRADDVSIVRVPPLPDDLTRGEKWIHVSLADQALVAMEGDRPVYATVVSTGLPTAARRTRPGTYRVESKHVSATMDSDVEGGVYSIEDVPWTMFYDHSYALHGAFWHERFGHPQSHGCVNVSATDSKWLFHWAGPTLPEGWYGMLATDADPGTRIVID